MAAIALAASALAVSAPAAAQPQTPPFSDTSPDAFYSEAVGALADGGVFDGTECTEGMLCPGEPIDRKTMAVWIVRALDGQDPAETADSRFSDVDADSFHGRFIERVADLGVTAGCGDGTGFCPDATVPRDQMAVFLTRAFELDPGTEARAGEGYGPSRIQVTPGSTVRLRATQLRGAPVAGGAAR